MPVKESLEIAEKTFDAAKEGSGLIEKLLSVNPRYRANKMLLDEIEHDPNMTPMEKYVAMRSLNKVKKEIMNSTNIYNFANLMLNGKGKSLEQLLPTVDDEWLGMYDDISKNVSSQEMQTVWAKILASKCEDENSVSKKLLQVLQIMDSNDAEYFSYLCSHSVMCFDPVDKEETPIFLYPDATKDELEVYDDKYINYGYLTNCSSLGLINYNSSIGTLLYKKANLLIMNYYGKKINIVSSNGEIGIGAVTYTSCGEELVKILHEGMSDKKDPLLISKISEYYKKNGYHVEG